MQPSALKYAVLWTNETQQPSQSEDFQMKLMFPESPKSSSVNNQRLVTFATAEKYVLTLWLIISHIKLVGLKFPRTEMLSSFQNKMFFFSTCKDVLFLFLWEPFYLCIIKFHSVPSGIGMENPAYQIILFYIFDIRQ